MSSSTLSSSLARITTMDAPKWNFNEVCRITECDTHLTNEQEAGNVGITFHQESNDGRESVAGNHRSDREREKHDAGPDKSTHHLVGFIVRRRHIGEKFYRLLFTLQHLRLHRAQLALILLHL